MGRNEEQKILFLSLTHNTHVSQNILHSYLLVQIFHILLPFDGQEGFLLIVAFLAASDKVVLCAFASPGQRNNMIHGQLIRPKKLGAVIADANGKLLLPPTAFPQLPGLILLPA